MCRADRIRPALLLALALCLGAPAAAQARLLGAESVLPPGQSGYVSIAGVAQGTGSPHLTDQTDLFTSFRRKSALFNQGGQTEIPRAGVKIVRDSFGVPAVTGDADYTAWWGAGYAVAQDRMFQLEAFRRATSGRLSEILGEGMLADDLVARRDYYTDAEIDEQLRSLPPSLLRRTEAYRDGINAWVEHLRSHPAEVPGEFVALGDPLPRWTLRDSARIGVFLARTVPSSDGRELENARALAELGSRAFVKLLPLRTTGRIPTVPREEGIFPSQPGRTRRQERRSYANSQRFLRGLDLPSAAATARSRFRNRAGILRTGGSYMWGIGRRLKTRKVCRGSGRRRHCVRRKVPNRRPGNAYVFNGPQLGFSIPELFVEFELHSPTQSLRGVSAAGVPVMGIGHNGRVAWGFTSGLSDEDDLYAEKLTGAESYEFRGQERRMDCRNEEFTFRSPPTDLPDLLPGLIKGTSRASGTRTERICRTVHGPVQLRSGGRGYARRYAIWNRELETLTGLTGLNDAHTVRQADRALQKVTWNENVVAVDDRGNIGYWHPGLHPLRPRNFDERLPYPGTGEAEWRGLLPRRRTPHVINPRQGYLFQWNNVPSVGWTNGDSEGLERATGPFHRSRLLQRLVGRVARHPSFEASKNIDRTSGTTAQQRPFFAKQLGRARRGTRGPERQVLDTLLRWHGSYVDADAAGTVDPGVAAWEEFKEQAAAIALFGLRRRPAGPATRDLSGKTGKSHMFDITNGEAYAFRTLRSGALRLAAARTHAALTRRFGSGDPAAWREPRRLYEVTAQGAGAFPDLPFFDRGTWEQSVGLGP